jgi:5-methylcytosine-specific restriction endonuclease McrA
MTAAILLLNASGEPLRVLNLKRALSLVFNGKAEVIEAYPDKKLRSPSVTLDFPCVLRLKRYINVPRKNAVWSRRAVFARDHYRCVYCNKTLSRDEATVDHLIPREICSREGIRASSWSNTVTACEKCNRAKASKRLEDSGLKFFDSNFIAKTPRTNYVVISGDCPTEWKKYIEVK